LEVCRTNGVYLRDGSVDLADKPDSVLRNKGSIDIAMHGIHWYDWLVNFAR